LQGQGRPVPDPPQREAAWAAPGTVSPERTTQDRQRPLQSKPFARSAQHNEHGSHPHHPAEPRHERLPVGDAVSVRENSSSTAGDNIEPLKSSARSTAPALAGVTRAEGIKDGEIQAQDTTERR
jgi:hypothetical protein